MSARKVNCGRAPINTRQVYDCGDNSIVGNGSKTLWVAVILSPSDNAVARAMSARKVNFGRAPIYTRQVYDCGDNSIAGNGSKTLWVAVMVCLL